MWYYDPFITFPIVFSGTGFFFFIIGILLFRKQKILASLCVAAFAGSGSVAVFTITFAWAMNNPERMEVLNQWISKIFA